MPIDAGDPLRDAQSLGGAVEGALAGLPDEERAEALKAVDYRWLGIGIRLGLERPDEARHLLEIIGADEADRVGLGDEDAVGGSPAGVPAVEGSGDPASIPARSALLARSAAVPFAERPSNDPKETFGWAGMLTRSEIQLLGRVVHEMLAAGASVDIGKGFGIAWDGGVRLPRRELDQLFREFTELQMTVAGVLAGRDLRSSRPLRRMASVDCSGNWCLGRARGSRRRPRRSRAAASRGSSAWSPSGTPGWQSATESSSRRQHSSCWSSLGNRRGLAPGAVRTTHREPPFLRVHDRRDARAGRKLGRQMGAG